MISSLPNTDRVDPTPYRGIALRWFRQDPYLWRVPVRSGEGVIAVAYHERTTSYVVHCIDDRDGLTLWTRTLVAGGYGAPIVVNDRFVAVLTDHVALAILDVATGRTLRTWRGDARIRSSLQRSPDGRVVFSAGGTVFLLDCDTGASATVATIDNCFLFGATAMTADGAVFSMGAAAVRGRSILYAYRVDCSGVVWAAEIDEGSIASSDTSGLVLTDDSVICGAGRTVTSLDPASGKPKWATRLPGLVTRCQPTVEGEFVHVVTLSGVVATLDAMDGSIRWTTTVTPEGLWSPPSLVGEQLLVVGGGSLLSYGRKDGLAGPSIPVGQSPYSAITLDGQGNATLGGGDPPFFGLLLGLSFTRASGPTLAIERVGDDRWRIATGSGAAAASVDLSMIGLGRRTCDRDGTFVSEASRFVAGNYAVPTELVDGTSTLSRLELQPPDDLPDSVSLPVSVPSQTTPLHSGAAVMARLLSVPDETSDEAQTKLRDEAESIIERSGSQPWDIWRLTARQVLHDPPEL